MYRCRTNLNHRIAQDVYDGKEVELSSPDPTRLEPPLPELLRLHAACAKVVHASGMAKTIEKWLQDLEKIKVLSKDGSKVELPKFGSVRFRGGLSQTENQTRRSVRAEPQIPH
jgi:hypothetical protein